MKYHLFIYTNSFTDFYFQSSYDYISIKLNLNTYIFAYLRSIRQILYIFLFIFISFILLSEYSWKSFFTLIHIFLLFPFLGLTLNIHQYKRVLDISVSFSPDLKKTMFTKGLLGVVDGNINNDFTAPNGTLFSPNMTAREIYNHGLLCKYTFFNYSNFSQNLVKIFKFLFSILYSETRLQKHNKISYSFKIDRMESK